MSGVEGNLKEREGPCGCINDTLTSAFSMSTSNTNASHHSAS